MRRSYGRPRACPGIAAPRLARRRGTQGTRGCPGTRAHGAVASSAVLLRLIPALARRAPRSAPRAALVAASADVGGIARRPAPRPRPGGAGRARPWSRRRSGVPARVPLGRAQRRRRAADHRRPPRGRRHRHDGRRPGRRAGRRPARRRSATSAGCATSSPPTTATGTCCVRALRAAPARQHRGARDGPQDRLLPRRPLRGRATARSPAARAEPVFESRCGLEQTQLLGIREGISVGYGDDYAANLEGQYLPLTGLADGRYVLVHRVNARPPDPRDRLRQQRRLGPHRAALAARRPVRARPRALPWQRGLRLTCHALPRVIADRSRVIARPCCRGAGTARSIGMQAASRPSSLPRSRRRPHGPLVPPPPTRAPRRGRRGVRPRGGAGARDRGSRRAAAGPSLPSGFTPPTFAPLPSVTAPGRAAPPGRPRDPQRPPRPPPRAARPAGAAAACRWQRPAGCAS